MLLKKTTLEEKLIKLKGQELNQSEKIERCRMRSNEASHNMTAKLTILKESITMMNLRDSELFEEHKLQREIKLRIAELETEIAMNNYKNQQLIDEKQAS